LHHQNYQESSIIVDVFTQAEGRVSLLAKGFRQQKSHYLGLLRPFMPLKFHYKGAQSLKILQHVESGSQAYDFPELNLYCAYYVNELIRSFLPEAEPYPDVFLAYLDCLQALQSNEAIEPALRCFEIQLIDALGYGLQLEFDVDSGDEIQPELRYHFDIEQGPKADNNGELKGSTLIAMQQENFTNPEQLQQAKQLMRSVIDFYLQGKTLRTRGIMSKLILQKTCKTH